MPRVASPFSVRSDFMRFSFNVRLTDEDYLLFNEFALKNSGMSKKADIIINILVSLIFILSALNLVLTNGMNTVSAVAVIFLVVMWLIFMLCSKRANAVFTKFFTRMLIKGKAKKPYTPDSVLEFYDGFFKEIAPDNKSEINYTALDKITVIKNRYVFLFLDGVRGYVVPFSCFKSEAQEKEFIDFLSTVCSKTELFDKI